MPNLLRPCLAGILLLACTSCTQRGFIYTPTPNGGYYVSLSEPKWTPPLPWGMVKRARYTLPEKLLHPFSNDGSYWRGDGVSGKPRIHIVLNEQRAFYYKGSTLVGESPICSGSDQFPTPTGNFRVIEKDADHLSSIYGDYIDRDGNILATMIDNRKDRRPPGSKFDGAKMHWFMRIQGAVGMHEGYLPGYADSHGCIRLPSHMAETFFKNTPPGTPVKVTPSR